MAHSESILPIPFPDGQSGQYLTASRLTLASIKCYGSVRSIVGQSVSPTWKMGGIWTLQRLISYPHRSESSSITSLACTSALTESRRSERPGNGTAGGGDSGGGGSDGGGASTGLIAGVVVRSLSLFQRKIG